jgi:hypothetical protein
LPCIVVRENKALKDNSVVILFAKLLNRLPNEKELIRRNKNEISIKTKSDVELLRGEIKVQCGNDHLKF